MQHYISQDVSEPQTECYVVQNNLTYADYVPETDTVLYTISDIPIYIQVNCNELKE